MEYKVKLEQFEGPLELLLHLIKESEIDIYDISISLITDQYLAHLELMQELNLDIAGEYLLMAATLTYIKSRTLIPAHKLEEDDELGGEDPKDILIRQLSEYRIYKEASLTLKGRESNALRSFSRFPTLDDQPEKADLLIEVGLFELVKAVTSVMSRLDDKERRLQFKLEVISVKERINEIIIQLEDIDNIAFSELFNDDATKGRVIATFLAILELIRLKVVKAKQATQNAAIVIYKQPKSNNEMHLEFASDDAVY
ncbi:MAG: segregation and condensation protein A [Nitrospinota bacterium]